MRKITLTFDNGPDPQITPQVLDCLANYGVCATFFVAGCNVAGNEALIERAVREGHWIGNHTFTHSGPLGLKTPQEAVDEIARTEQALGFLGEPVRWFRPVGGGGRIGPHLLQPSAIEYLVQNRYSAVLWNSVPGDWRDPDGWLERAKSDCRAHPWTLTVLHDHRPGGLLHLEQFLQWLRQEDFTFMQPFPQEYVMVDRGRIMVEMRGYSAGSL